MRFGRTGRVVDGEGAGAGAGPGPAEVRYISAGLQQLMSVRVALLLLTDLNCAGRLHSRKQYTATDC